MPEFVRSGFIIDAVTVIAGAITGNAIVFATGDKDTTFFIFASQTGSMQIQIDPRGTGSWQDIDGAINYATANKWQTVSLDYKLPRTRVVFTPGAFPCTASILAQGSGVR